MDAGAYQRILGCLCELVGLSRSSLYYEAATELRSGHRNGDQCWFDVFDRRASLGVTVSEKSLDESSFGGAPGISRYRDQHGCSKPCLGKLVCGLSVA